MSKYPFLIVLLVTFLVYLNSFGNAFVWDDLNNIVGNNTLIGPLRLRDIFLKSSAAQIFHPHANGSILTGSEAIGLEAYRPIPYLTLYLDWFFWKDNPLGYHLTNLAFHLACVILVFLLTKRLTRSKKLSFLCALLFAVHPVHTEAVTYISGRSDILCGFFIFSAFYLWLRACDYLKIKRVIYLLAGLFSFLLALLSKEIALIFPLVILGYSLYFYRDFCPEPKDKKFLYLSNLIFFLSATSYLFFRYLWVKMPTAVALGKFYLLPKFFLFYLKTLIFPFNLHMQHSLKENDFFLQLPLFLAVLIFAGGIVTAIKFMKEKYLRFGLFWFFLGMLPFLGFFQFNADMAEHWLYIGSFGFFLIAGSFISKSSLLKNKFAFFSLIFFLCFLTFQRNRVWRDDISIYTDTLRYNSSDPRLHYNLGNAYLRRELLKEAAQEYLISLKLKPDYAFALNNLGVVKERQKDLKGAYQLYRQAVSHSPLEVARRNLLQLEFSGLAFADEENIDTSVGYYGGLLRQLVKDGLVDYASLKRDPYLLNTYLEQVARLDIETFDSFSKNEKLALYLNVYNAFTLEVILWHHPVKSIKDIPGVWDKFKVKIAGREFSLNEIEHGILRKQFQEPRIHFALVCASKGCPKLRGGGPFRGIDLSEQLDEQAQEFINDQTKVRLDKESNILYLSSIFKWFKEDFGDVVEFINRYLPQDEREFIKKRNPGIKYLNYDWALNEKL